MDRNRSRTPSSALVVSIIVIICASLIAPPMICDSELTAATWDSV
jgi:hypothetical protein